MPWPFRRQVGAKDTTCIPPLRPTPEKHLQDPEREPLGSALAAKLSILSIYQDRKVREEQVFALL